MESYQLEGNKPLGEGSFGKVFKAKEKSTGRIVALKRMKFDLTENGLPGAAMREISNMRELKHNNIVRILNIVHAGAGTLYLVIEHLEMDLRKYMDLVRKGHDSGRLPVPLIQRFSRHLVKGVAYCHSHRILHRDLKPGNLLIDAQQRLKIADFGSSHAHSIPLQYTSPREVTTLWYRAPEVLLGERNYTSAIDIWSVGCIIAEMARAGMQVFMGTTETDQVQRIFQVLGTPDETMWPGVSMLPEWRADYQKWPTRNIFEVIPHIPEPALDLVITVPRTAQRALLHPWLNKYIPQEFPESLMDHYVSTE